MQRRRVVRPLHRVAAAMFRRSEDTTTRQTAGSAAGGIQQSGGKAHAAAMVPPASSTDDEIDDSTTPYAVLLLNAPATIHQPFFLPLWNGAAVTACGDGGSTRLHSAFGTKYVPTFIAGDLDSSTKDIQSKFQSHGSTVVPLPDQSKNDFEKCLELLAGRVDVGAVPGVRGPTQTVPAVREVYVFGGLDGRLDHTFANISVVHQYDGVFPGGLVLISGHSVAVLLGKGSHTVHAYAALEGATCGLLPAAGPAESVSTKGLKWDVTDTTVAVGGYVNSSNAFAEEGADTTEDTDDRDNDDSPMEAWEKRADRRTIHVETSSPLIWTTEIRSVSCP
eukprot:m.42346 g.42346  ORF g.42346 m.42346 type:complete len:334 (+) comp6262_c1_seq1:180-1181(+)